MLQFVKPKVGRKIRVIVRQGNYLDDSIDPRTYVEYTYDGTVLNDIPMTGPKAFEMTGPADNNHRIPFRQIQLNRVQSLAYLDGDSISREDVVVADDEVWEVAGSKGKTYTVRRINDKVTCTCPGFTYRGACKHSKAKE